MSQFHPPRPDEKQQGWLAAVEARVSGMLHAIGALATQSSRQRAAQRQHAELVPSEQSRAEADLVREAVSYKGGAQGG